MKKRMGIRITISTMMLLVFGVFASDAFAQERDRVQPPQQQEKKESNEDWADDFSKALDFAEKGMKKAKSWFGERYDRPQTQEEMIQMMTQLIMELQDKMDKIQPLLERMKKLMGGFRGFMPTNPDQEVTTNPF